MIANLTQASDIESADKTGLPKYLTTSEASVYLRKSVSWLIRRNNIPYMPGNPNIYLRADLDEWFETNKHKPLV